jgi:hypothetical protein
MKKFLLSAISGIIIFNSTAQDLSYYLPTDVTYNQDIPTPKDVIGHEVGEWHVSHDKLVFYMKMLEQASDRVVIEEYASSYEGRPLMLLRFTNPKNQKNIATIKQTHVDLSDPTKSAADDALPVLWLGYSVHGNEASGANASLLTAYYLAAAQGAKIDKLLKENIILVDPSYNPDGLQRFSTWVNMHKSENLVADPSSREFDEVWPGGRTNHYWFDLNRDWMPVQHPESIGRIRKFHEWKPNILTDHHEMGTNSTFFFQPGIPSRKNPNTPNSNVRLTEKIAEYHVKSLDSIGSLYYSKESFDDFYVGKGSTYPDQNGSVGILFEQASARGHLQKSAYGELSFPFAIKNHFQTSLSTIDATVGLRTELLTNQKSFYKEALNIASKDKVKGYIFGSKDDLFKNYELIRILKAHQIHVFANSKSLVKNGQPFSLGSSYIVPTNQAQYRLIKSLFEKRTTFTDSLFYDVSAWTLPLSFNLPYAALDATAPLGNEITSLQFPEGEITGKGDYAYIFEMKGYYAHRALKRLLKAGITVQINENPFSINGKSFDRGTAVIPLGTQKSKVATIDSIMRFVAKEDGIDVMKSSTGYAQQGIDMGSGSMNILKLPTVAILVGDGVSSYEAGEVWHLLDQRFGMAVTLLPVENFGKTKLSKYNRIVMTNGNFSKLNNQKAKLETWLNDGGVIIAWKSAGKWLAEQGFSKVEYAKNMPDTSGIKKYVELSKNRGAQVIGGAIFEAQLDMGHPLTYGFTHEKMPLFRNHTSFMKPSKNPYAQPIKYTNTPLLSGYISDDNLEKISGTAAVTISKRGQGKMIIFADNPNFRAFWFGTNKLFLNALFFGDTISPAAAE